MILYSIGNEILDVGTSRSAPRSAATSPSSTCPGPDAVRDQRHQPDSWPPARTGPRNPGRVGGARGESTTPMMWAGVSSTGPTLRSVTAATAESHSVLDVAGHNYPRPDTRLDASASRTGSWSGPKRCPKLIGRDWRLVTRLPWSSATSPGQAGTTSAKRASAASTADGGTGEGLIPGTRASPPGRGDIDITGLRRTGLVLPRDRLRAAHRPVHRRPPTRDHDSSTMHQSPWTLHRRHRFLVVAGSRRSANRGRGLRQMPMRWNCSSTAHRWDERPRANRPGYPGELRHHLPARRHRSPVPPTAVGDAIGRVSLRSAGAHDLALLVRSDRTEVRADGHRPRVRRRPASPTRDGIVHMDRYNWPVRPSASTGLPVCRASGPATRPPRAPSSPTPAPPTKAVHSPPYDPPGRARSPSRSRPPSASP